MTKQKFLDKLRAKLKGLPKREVEETLSFYSEMIDDRIEDGCSEEDAVLAVGDVDKIAADKLGGELSEKPSKSGAKKIKQGDGKKLALIIAGSPLWVPLLISALAVIFSLYVSAWAIIVSLWSAFAAFAVSAPAGIILGLVLFFKGMAFNGTVSISLALVALSLAIFSFFACLWLTKKFATFTTYTLKLIKALFNGKEKNQ